MEQRLVSCNYCAEAFHVNDAGYTTKLFHECLHEQKSQLITDFAIHGEDFGIYYSETKRAIIYLINHESLDEILKTTNHETLHYIFDLFDLVIDEEQEHKLIFKMQWAKEYL